MLIRHAAAHQKYAILAAPVGATPPQAERLASLPYSSGMNIGSRLPRSAVACPHPSKPPSQRPALPDAKHHIGHRDGPASNQPPQPTRHCIAQGAPPPCQASSELYRTSWRATTIYLYQNWRHWPARRVSDRRLGALKRVAFFRRRSTRFMCF